MFTTPGAPLVLPTLAEAARGVIELNLSVFEFNGPNITQLTRAYNGGLMGPLIRVRPGEQMRVRLSNQLGPERCDTSAVHNHMGNANVTTLHTHGLHISPNWPQDDALSKVHPGETREYVYEVPAEHMGGTYWYHPHAHGADAQQGGGGAFGMLIVEDSELSQLPAAVAALEDVPLVLISLDMPELSRFAREYMSNCLTQPGCTAATCDDPIWGHGPRSGEPADVLLVNGQTRPTITLAARRWYRWRLLYASGGGEVIYPQIPGCEVGLLAKDGIYLHRAPRPITRGFMAGGNRADWLVRCPLGTHEFNATTRKSSRRPEGARDLAWVVATEQGDIPVEIPSFSVRRPCYLADLTDAPTNQTVVLDGRSMFQFNRHSWAGEHEYEAAVEAGSVVGLEVYGLHYQYRMGHILHVHVNPFQLAEEPADSWGGYFQKGDWHDTLKGPSSWTRERPVRLKMALDRFTGGQVVHCHYLWHEDRGMMYMFKIQGVEGATVALAPHLEPTCYSAETARLARLSKPVVVELSGDEMEGKQQPGVGAARWLVALLLAGLAAAAAALYSHRRHHVRCEGSPAQTRSSRAVGGAGVQLFRRMAA